jgi:hypothetical protein
MAQPARQQPEHYVDPSLPLDPGAVRREYRRQRLLRKARRERIRQRRLAALRFALFIMLLLGLSLVLTVIAWHEVQRLFGI